MHHQIEQKKLSLKKEEVLRFGLDQHILPSKTNLDSFKVYQKRLMYSIKSKLKITQFDEETKDQMKYLFQNFIQNTKL